MKIGFIGLGKLGLPCALAIKDKGHQVWGYDIDPKVKEILDTKILPYREEGTPELLQKHTIDFGSIDDVVNNSEIIFIPIQTPHEYKYEGCTRIPEERDDFDYEWLKNGISDLSNSIKKQTENKVVVIISTVLPGTIEREIMPIIKDNDKFKLCYNPFFIAMGTTVYDFLNPEFVLFGVYDEWASNKAEEFYKTIHNKPFYKTDIINAELIKVCYNTFIGMKIVFANTIMEICHKNGANSDEVMGGIKLGIDRVISTKYLSGGMGDGGGCVLYDFNINVNDESVQIGDFYNTFHNNDKIFLVDSANYTCNTKQKKKIADVKKRKFNGDLYTLTTKSNKKIILTSDQIIPVDRSNKRILIRVCEIEEGDKLFVL